MENWRRGFGSKFKVQRLSKVNSQNLEPATLLDIEPELLRLHHSFEHSLQVIAAELDHYGTTMGTLGGKFNLIEVS